MWVARARLPLRPPASSPARPTRVHGTSIGASSSTSYLVHIAVVHHHLTSSPASCPTPSPGSQLTTTVSTSPAKAQLISVGHDSVSPVQGDLFLTWCFNFDHNFILRRCGWLIRIRNTRYPHPRRPLFHLIVFSCATYNPHLSHRDRVVWKVFRDSSTPQAFRDTVTGCKGPGSWLLLIR